MALRWNKQKPDDILQKAIIDADYADDLGFDADTPAQPEYVLHSQEHKKGGISLHVKTNKIEYICFEREGLVGSF